MNAMLKNKTEEERRVIYQKSAATRTKNALLRRQADESRKERCAVLMSGINLLEQKLASLKHEEKMNTVSASINGKSLWREDEIVKQSLSWSKSSGIYFLINNDKVVYVGQSTHVFSRIAQHKDKKFDRYAYVPCPPDMLDKLESLYIHTLNPEQNGNQCHGGKLAPLSLKQLLE